MKWTVLKTGNTIDGMQHVIVQQKDFRVSNIIIRYIITNNRYISFKLRSPNCHFQKRKSPSHKS